MSRAHEIKLIGTTFDGDINHDEWWKYEKEQDRLAELIEKKNANVLQDVFKKMVEQNVYMIEVPFSGGGDCGGFDGNINYYDNKEKEIKIDFNKLKPIGHIEHYKPLIYKKETPKKGKKVPVQIFEYSWTNYNEINITEDWLITKFYEFGFLNEWGSFAGDFHVNGTVKIWPKTGKYQMPYQQSVEEYEDHEPEGEMFNESETSTKD